MFITFLRRLPNSGPFLIVTPLSLVSKWIQDFQKWAPSLPVAYLGGTVEERDAMYSAQLNPVNRKKPYFPVIITSYEVAIRDQECLNRIGKFKYTCIDEGGLEEYRHIIISTTKGIVSDSRLLLGAGPVYHDLVEFAETLTFMHERFFSQSYLFRENYLIAMSEIKRGINKEREQQMMAKMHSLNISEMNDLVMPFVLNHTNKE